MLLRMRVSRPVPYTLYRTEAVRYGRLGARLPSQLGFEGLFRCSLKLASSCLVRVPGKLVGVRWPPYVVLAKWRPVIFLAFWTVSSYRKRGGLGARLGLHSPDSVVTKELCLD